MPIKFYTPPKLPAKMARQLEKVPVCKTVYFCIEDVFTGVWFGVLGDGDNAIYETFKFDSSGVLTVSSKGYGDTLYALKTIMDEVCV